MIKISSSFPLRRSICWEIPCVVLRVITDIQKPSYGPCKKVGELHVSRIYLLLSMNSSSYPWSVDWIINQPKMSRILLQYGHCSSALGLRRALERVRRKGRSDADLTQRFSVALFLVSGTILIQLPNKAEKTGVCNCKLQQSLKMQVCSFRRGFHMV